MTTDKNAHIKDYLAYYIELPHSPNYAVMISGPWGVGKTHLVKKFLTDFVEGKKKYVYVSLYGLSSIDEIDDALLQAIYPALGWKTTKVASRIGKGLLKKFIGDPELKIGELINKFDVDFYIFDDLERYEGPINKVLGYINQFVEHDGCKVVVIANENEISNDGEYRKRREKLIGKTLEVQSAFDDAFSFFLSRIDDPDAKAIFEKNGAEIASIYAQSKLDNLRILQQTMWDFERLVHVLTSKQRGNPDAVKALLRLVFPLSFELKADHINADDLRTRNRFASLITPEKKEKTRLMLAGDKYPEIDLADSLLENDVLVDCLSRGIVDEKQVQASLSKSSYFARVEDEPAWRTTWHWFERTDEQFEKAVNEMEAEFLARKFTKPGEILHVLGLRLFLSKLGIINISRADVVTECKKYIDDLYRQKRLEAFGDETGIVRFNGFGGLGICENDTTEYQELLSYLRSNESRREQDTYPGKASTLLNEMETDPQLFYRRICSTNSPENIFYGIPILAAVDADVFVDAFLKLHPSHQHTVMMALKARYEYGRLDRDMPTERPWIEAVRDKLVKKAEKASVIAKRRLVNHLEWYVDPVLKKPSKKTFRNDRQRR